MIEHPFKRTRPRPRRDDVRPAVALARGLAVAAIILLVGFVCLRAGSGLPFSDPYRIDVELADAGSLRPGSGVDIAGVRVGTVQGKSPAPGGRARIEIRLDGGTDRLPVDTTAQVRAQGLLGARFLELVPGTSPERLRSGATIRGGEISNGVPEALVGFDTRTRAAMGETVRTLGRGLADRGEQLNDAIGAAPAIGGDVSAISEAVLAREGAAARLMPSLASGMTALDSAAPEMARGFAPATAALQPFIDRRPAVADTLERAPAAFASAEAGLAEGRRLLAAARDLSSAASRTLPSAPAGLEATTTLLRTGRSPLRRAAPLVEDLGRTVPSVLRVTKRLDPVLGPVRSGLNHLRAPVREIGRRRCDLDNFAENWRSMLGYGVKGGGRIGPMNSIRIEAIGSNESVAGLGPVGRDLLLPNGTVTRNAYPDACQYSPGPAYAEDRASAGSGR